MIRRIIQEWEEHRFDQLVEFMAAVILSLATMGTAWCGYQAARWNGEKSSYSSAASSANLHAAQLANRAIVADTRNVDIFIQWSVAEFNDNQEFADYLFARFPEELALATEAWLALEPMQNPNAPLSPFDMAEYQLVDLQASEELLIQVEVDRAKSSDASQIADRYILLTVLFASVLFFAGISGKFKSQLVDLGMLGLAILLLLTIGIILFSYPVIIEI